MTHDGLVLPVEHPPERRLHPSVVCHEDVPHAQHPHHHDLVLEADHPHEQTACSAGEVSSSCLSETNGNSSEAAGVASSL